MKNRSRIAVGILLVALPLFAQEEAIFPPPPDNVNAVATLPPANEPGEPLTIRGTVYHADGTTPYAGFVLFLYQTDRTGLYNNTNRSWREPRIRGWVKTDDSGRYEIQTIKPGSYPGSRNPAHIHAVIKLPGKRARWIDDFLFEDDPFVTADLQSISARQGKFANVMKVKREKGRLSAWRDIKINDMR